MFEKVNIMILTHDIALFQYFQSKDSIAARVMKDEEFNWGFYLPDYQKWVDYNEGIEKYGLEPCYEIHKEPFDYKGYVHIKFQKGKIYCIRLLISFMNRGELKT